MYEAVKILREAAERIEQSGILPELHDGMTIREAVQAVRSVVPDNHCSIAMELDSYSSDKAWTLKFTVWDGNKHHEGKTLRQAVERTIAANKPVELIGSPLDEAQRQLDTVAVPTF